MSNPIAGTKNDLSPLERKNTPAVKNDFEGSFEKPIGYYEPYKPQSEGFSATGSMDLTSSTTEYKFNPSSIVNEGLVTQSNILKSNEFVPFIENVGTGLGAVANFFIDSAKTAADAITEGVKENVTFKTLEAQKPVDPQEEVEEQRKQAVMIATENANAVLENAEKQASREDYEKMIEMALRLGVNVESLADQLSAPHLRKADLLRVYYIALGATKLEAEQKIAARVNTIVSPAKHGAEGPGMIMEDNKQGETQHGKNTPG